MQSYTSPIDEAIPTTTISAAISSSPTTNSNQDTAEIRRNSLLNDLSQRRTSQEQTIQYSNPIGEGSHDKYTKDSVENEKQRSARESPAPGRRRSSIRFNDDIQSQLAITAAATDITSAPIISGYERGDDQQRGSIVYDTSQYGDAAASYVGDVMSQQQQQTPVQSQPYYEPHTSGDRFEQTNYDYDYGQQQQIEPQQAIIDDNQYAVQYGDATSNYNTNIDYTTTAPYEQQIYDQQSLPQQQFSRRSSQHFSPTQQYYTEPATSNVPGSIESSYPSNYQFEATEYERPPSEQQQRDEPVYVAAQPTPTPIVKALSSATESNASTTNLGTKYRGNGRSEQQQQQQQQPQQPQQLQTRQTKSKVVVPKQSAKKKFT